MGAQPSHLNEVRISNSAGNPVKKSKKRWTWRNRAKFTPPEPDPLPPPLTKSPSFDLDGVPAPLGGPHSNSTGSIPCAVDAKQLKKEAQSEVDLRLQNAAENPNIRQLDLKGLNLKSVPKRVFELHHITNLLLSNNNLGKLSTSIKNLTELHVLDVSSNKLTSVPSLSALVDLISLDLSKNRLISISKQAFDGLRNLEKLELYCNQLVDLPDEICYLNSLSILVLSTNHLTTLPAQIGNLSECLRILDVDNNHFESFPESFSSLGRLIQLTAAHNNFTEFPTALLPMYGLEKVDLRMNKICSIPEAIAKMESLTNLNLSENAFTTFPNELSGVPRLVELDLSKNRIRSDDIDFSKFLELCQLKLSNNQLTTLPPSLGSLTVLMELDVSNNKLKEFPPEIGNLVYLGKIRASNNRLQELPVQITAIEWLQELYLAHNQIQQLPTDFSKLQRLTVLQLSHNRLTGLPDDLGKLCKLKTLDVSQNELSEFPSSISQLVDLENLNLAFNKLEVLPEGIGSCTQLVTLFVAYNKLVSLPDSITNISTLTEIFASHNQLTSLPLSIGKLKSLQRLLIAFNNFTSIPREITQLKTLKILDIGGNKLNECIPELSALANLKELTLAHNNLENIPFQLSNITSLEQLYLDHNKLITLPGVMNSFVGRANITLHDNDKIILPRELEWYIEDTSSDHVVKSLHEVGFAEMIGRRPRMEDIVVVKRGFRGRQEEDFFAVYDGHGGRKAVRYVARNFHHLFARNLDKTGQNPIESLRKTYLSSHTFMDEFSDGTTAATAYIQGNKLFVANAGDTRIVISKRGQAVPLTIDHTPTLKDEEDRIVALGGFVSSHRVNGILGVSRSLGDGYLHPFVTPDPHLATVELNEEHELLIIACDGVWDVMSNQEAVDIALSEQNPYEASMKIRDCAYVRGSTDNISALVVRFSLQEFVRRRNTTESIPSTPPIMELSPLDQTSTDNVDLSTVKISQSVPSFKDVSELLIKPPNLSKQATATKVFCSSEFPEPFHAKIDFTKIKLKRTNSRFISVGKIDPNAIHKSSASSSSTSSTSQPPVTNSASSTTPNTRGRSSTLYGANPNRRLSSCNQYSPSGSPSASPPSKSPSGSRAQITKERPPPVVAASPSKTLSPLMRSGRYTRRCTE
eukprot:TRINITY_DN2184_c0_g1_i1.p1 TRINITY_DN2184_c0_g1~~TRINITY_DN2184_c0_g1_i1.p1  ORF type:complete len:1146 (-),score=229.32 TRINITY_DN2184_c0_g1_i1:276-3713(-)